jgi:hypothetical protein
LEDEAMSIYLSLRWLDGWNDSLNGRGCIASSTAHVP